MGKQDLVQKVAETTPAVGSDKGLVIANGEGCPLNTPHWNTTPPEQYRANTKVMGKYLIHSLNSGDFAATAKKKNKRKKKN